MTIFEKLSNSWRTIFKAIAIYAAAAWAIIQVIDFAVSNYGLSRLLLDAAVLVSFGGGIVTAVLAWFHGESGPQKAKAPEIAIIFSIIFATAASVSYLALRDPADIFNYLEGYRLTLEFRGKSAEDYLITLAPLETVEYYDGIMYNLAPDEGSLEGPNIAVKFQEHPVLFLSPTDSEWITLLFVLPFEPVDIANLRQIGTFHDSAKFGTKGLSVIIETNFEIIEQQSGVKLRLIE